MGRRIRGVFLLTAVATSAGGPVALAQVARPPVAPAGRPPAAPASGAPAAGTRPLASPNDPRMRQVLREWEQRSARLKSLDVKILRVDKDPAWGDDQMYEGRAFLQSPNLACLDFKKVGKGPQGKKSLIDSERIICTGKEVWQYKSDAKQIFIFPLDQENQKRALEEGPLPFLFNMRAADAEARYQMTIVREDKAYFVLSIVPRLQIDRESFSKAFLQLNRATYLPDRIYLVSPNGKASKDFSLVEVQPNVAINPRNFQGIPLPKPWIIERNPGMQEAQRPQPRLGNQPAPAVPAGVAPRRR